MIDTERSVVFACRSCSRTSSSPRSPVNVCDDCGGQLVLRYADHVDGVGGVGGAGDGTGAADRGGGGRGA